MFYSFASFITGHVSCYIAWATLKVTMSYIISYTMTQVMNNCQSGDGCYHMVNKEMRFVLNVGWMGKMWLMAWLSVSTFPLNQWYDSLVQPIITGFPPNIWQKVPWLSLTSSLNFTQISLTIFLILPGAWNNNCNENHDIFLISQ